MSVEQCSLKPCFTCCEGQQLDPHERRDSGLDDTIIKAEHGSIGVSGSEDERLQQWREDETQVQDSSTIALRAEPESVESAPPERFSDRLSLGTESQTMSYLSVPPTSTTRRQSIVEVSGGLSGGRRQSIVEVTKKRSRGSGSSSPRASVREKAWKFRLRRILASKWWQISSLLVVFCALFLVDIYGLAQVPENTSLDIMGMACFSFFVVELVLNSLVTEGYINSFFFWMDILGTTSLIFDISFFLGLDATQPLRYGNDGSVAGETAVLARASRAAKQAARAGRVSRVLKLIRFLPFLRAKENHEVANAVSMKLTTMLATRVAFLAVCIVLILPLFTFLQYPEEEHSMISWAMLISIDVEAYTANPSTAQLNWINSEIARFVQFYQGLFYGPFGLCFKVNGAFDCSTGAIAGLRFEGSRWVQPQRPASIAQVDYDQVRLLFTLEAVRQYEAMANICLMFTVLLLMLVMCFLMNSSVNKVVLKPLQRVVVVLRQHCADIMKITFEMPNDQETGAARQSSREMVSTDGEEKEQEVELLEKVLKKIVYIFETVVPQKRTTTDKEEALFLDNFAGAEEEERTAAPIMKLKEVDTLEDHTPGISQEMRRQLDDRTLNVFEVGEEQQRAIALYVMTNTRSCRRWVRRQGMKDTLSKFIHAVQGRYPANPFHNFGHGLDVLSEVRLYLHGIKSYTIFSEVTVFWLLVAAMGHDLGHLGVNNQFLVETSHLLALRYNDRSVLENMHCALLFEVLSDASCNVLKALEKADYKTARAGIVEVILGTDMVRHNEDIKALSISYTMHQEAFQDAAKDRPEPLSMALQEDSKARLKVLGALLHTADVSNPMKPWEICALLADRCLEEFFAQGDKEKELGIPVQMLNDREKVNRCTSQVGFIEFVIAPLAEQVVTVFPSLNFLTGNLSLNIQTWQDLWVTSNPPPEEVEKLRARVQKVMTRCGAYPWDAVQRQQSGISGVSGLSDAL